MSDLAAIAVTVSPADKFREYLVTRGMRLTRERELVVAEVFSHHEHFDSDQLVERLAGQKLAGQKEGKRVSRATVYRTLNEMVEAGLLLVPVKTGGEVKAGPDHGKGEEEGEIVEEIGQRPLQPRLARQVRHG